MTQQLTIAALQSAISKMVRIVCGRARATISIIPGEDGATIKVVIPTQYRPAINGYLAQHVPFRLLAEDAESLILTDELAKALVRISYEAGERAAALEW